MFFLFFFHISKYVFDGIQLYVSGVIMLIYIIITVLGTSALAKGAFNTLRSYSSNKIQYNYISWSWT